MSQGKGGLRFQPAGGARQAKIPVGKKQTLRIERLAHDGRGIAFEQGRTWFVAGALPEEQVRAEVLAVRSKVVEARADQVLAASPQRQAAFCPHYGVCGGCTLQHLSSEQQLIFKQQAVQELLAKEGLQHLPWQPAITGAAQGYRRRARIALYFSRKTRQLQVGFRALGSTQIIAIDNCSILEPALQQLYQALLPILQQLKQPEVLGHLELFSGDQLAFFLRLVKPLATADQQQLEQFAKQQRVQFWWQLEAEPVLAAESGFSPDLSFAVEPGNLHLQWRPGDFIQVNAEVNQQMIQQALEWLELTPNSKVLDLFCGLGNFSLPLAQQAKQVLGIEGAAAMVARAADNAARNGLTNVEFIQADLTQPLSVQLHRADFDRILLDPPREGAYELVHSLAEFKAANIVYVSCNPATLARDAAVLVQHGYTLHKISVMNMFPQTGHIETMVSFRLSEHT